MADEKRPRRPRKAPAKKAAPRVTAADRKKAAEQLEGSNVVPIKKAARTGRSNNRTRPDDLRLHERRMRVLSYRRLGMQWSEVADAIRNDAELGRGVPRYSKADAYNDGKALLDSVTVEAALATRAEDLAILLAMQRGVITKAMSGELDAVRAMQSILDQRAKYLGLYAPVRHQLTGADGGPIQVDTTSDAAVQAAALEALDSLLPHAEPYSLPGAPS